MLQDFIRLFFPKNCAACEQALLKGEDMICINCQLSMPRAAPGFSNSLQGIERFHHLKALEQVHAFYKYQKGNKVQNILHEIKYRNKPELGQQQGRYFGSELKSKLTALPDALVPVPLYYKKQLLRGYNQSEQIAQGIAEVLQVPVWSNVVARRKATETQTKKSRMERFFNVDEVFEVTDRDTLQGKHIAIIDDVLTTGATIEVCAEALEKAGAAQISIFVLAMAE